MKQAMRIRIALLLVAVGCSSKSAKTSTAYAVGAYVGPNALSPSTECTFDADPASAAQLNAGKTVGTLVAPGKLKVTCLGDVTTYDILKPTMAKIHRADADKQDIKIGETATYKAEPFAGDRDLTSRGHFAVTWKPGPDCANTATTEVDMPAGGDSLHGTYALGLIGKAAGTCTLTAEIVGMTATQTVTIR